MRKTLMRKKILKIISIIIILFIMIYIVINNIVNTNKLDNLIINIKNNYEINEEISYINEYNNYYIFATKTRVIVLNKEYQEILNESLNIIEDIPKNKELIYKTNKLMFEETILKENKLIYKYYDATNGEFIKETVMEMH